MKKSYFLTLLVSFLTVFSQEIYADNKLTVENLTIKAGEQGVLQVNLTKDNALLSSYQMDLELPDGFTVGQIYNEDDEEYVVGVVTSSDMHKSDGMLSVGEITKGVNISYLNSKTLKSATSGLLLSIYIDVASTVLPGTYDLKLSDIIFSTNEDPAKEVTMADVSFTITVPGDAAETVEIALGNASGYNTYVSGKDLDFTGLEAKAYIVSSVSATEATLTQVDAIKAGEGFIIEGAGEGTIEVPVAAETPAASGTLLATGQPSEGDYLLAKDGTAFVKWNGEGTLAATKAYLPASAISSGAKIINIAFGESTGISEVKKSEADGAIYNLSGMRVSKTQKGVYIMNGRKVIVK